MTNVSLGLFNKLVFALVKEKCTAANVVLPKFFLL